MERMKIVAATDGSCPGNPGVGGYAAVMTAKGKTKQISGYIKTKTTNNRMELRAVIEVIKWLNEHQKVPCEVEVLTDSNYIVVTHKKPLEELKAPTRDNHDMWIELINECKRGNHHITFVKVKGHSDNEMNAKADLLAKAAAKEAQREIYGY